MKIGMFFPGYGTQFVGMGKEFYDTSRTVQEYFEEASNCLDENFVKLCFASSDAELSKISNAYPALFLTSVSIVSLLREKGINPDVVAGYGLGEFSALFAAGSLTFPDGLYILSKYALFYQEELANMDVATVHVRDLSRNLLEQEMAELERAGKSVTIANYRGSTDHIVSGYRPAIEALEERLDMQKRAKLKRYAPAVGLHSSLMDRVVEQLMVYREKVDFRDLNVPLVYSRDAQYITVGNEVKEKIIEQLNHPVMWDQVMEKLSSCDLLIEIGPGSSLSSLMKKQYPEKKILSVQKLADIDELIRIIETDNKTAEL